MAKIIIVDDDYALNILADNLRDVGHDVRKFESASDALENIEIINSADILILDMIMQPPNGSSRVSGGRVGGMSVYQGIRKSNQDLKILVYTANDDGDIQSILARDSNAKYLGKWSTPSLDEILTTLEKMLGLPTRKKVIVPFIVHGHDDRAKLETKNYLQNVLKLGEPIILHEQPSLGRTVIEKLEDYAAQSHLAFVLLTPDDVVATGSESNDQKRRARQNVIFELGYFLGIFGRHSGRVFLLYKGPLELPSDLGGVIYIDIGRGIEAAGELIRKELAHVIK